jgi:hypothetical protein
MISNCDDVRGMIPWLLNGTLDENERRQALQHLATCATCRRDLADTRLTAEIFDQHLPAEAILALAWNETPGGIDPAFLEEHLAECPHCAAELELARMSRRLEEDERIVPLARRAAPAPAPGRSTGRSGWKAAVLAAGLAGLVAFGGWFKTAERVHSLQEQLAQRPAAPAQAPAPSAIGGSGEESVRAQQLAAQLEQRLKEVEQEAATLRTQEKELRGRLDQLADAGPAVPQINAWIQDVQPSGDVVRGGGPAAALEIPARTSAVLLLGASHPETHREHAVEIVDGAGQAVWSAAGLTRNTQNNLYVLTVPPGSLPAGTYTIHVYATADGRREPLESYAIQVR